ncbi:MAG TPA: hypothetical protein VEI28_06490 [Thermodesulfovibrionales bacterium]|nr:hypothetical protein [Thermodesulfovibrionales bacterium]
MLEGLLKKFETLMMAITYAEAGEIDTAREIMEEDHVRKTKRPTQRKRKAERERIRAD